MTDLMYDQKVICQKCKRLMGFAPIAHLKEVAHKQFLESIKGAVEKSNELVDKADEAIRQHRWISRRLKERKDNEARGLDH